MAFNRGLANAVDSFAGGYSGQVLAGHDRSFVWGGTNQADRVNSSGPDQFDIWFKPELHRGETAIIVADSSWPIDYAAGMFERVTPLQTVEITSFGRVIYTPTLYLMENFSPPAAENWK